MNAFVSSPDHSLFASEPSGVRNYQYYRYIHYYYYYYRQILIKRLCLCFMVAEN